MSDKLTVADIEQWIDNDEGLYRWWKSERKAKRVFIRENRAALEEAINNVTGNKKQAHYLAYGPDKRY
jgi:hypothetical protein